MRRLVIIGAALAVLGGAGAAYAASHYNNDSGSKLAISKGVALSQVQVLNQSAPAGERPGPLTRVTFKIYGVKLDFGKLPVCTDAKIEKNKTNPNGGCPAGSLIGNGPVHSVLGPTNNPSSSVGVVACNPFLHVFNGGPRTQVLYLYTKTPSDCHGLTTGATAPYDAHISYSGKYAIIDIPQPPDVSTHAANLPFYGSLMNEVISFAKTVHGKAYMVGVSCKSGKRPWSITMSDQKYDGTRETQTITGKSAC